VLGHDIVREAAAVRCRIALAGQAAIVDEDLTGRENLSGDRALGSHSDAQGQGDADGG
jgi:ABC-2 type transport system ATP-binding protein